MMFKVYCIIQVIGFMAILFFMIMETIQAIGEQANIGMIIASILMGLGSISMIVFLIWAYREDY